MNITRIKLPKFKIGKYVLNHYELEQYQYEVLTGQRPGNVLVKCMLTGQINIIRDNGNMSSRWSENSTYGTTMVIAFKRQEYQKNGKITLAPIIKEED